MVEQKPVHFGICHNCHTYDCLPVSYVVIQSYDNEQCQGNPVKAISTSNCVWNHR